MATTTDRANDTEQRFSRPEAPAAENAATPIEQRDAPAPDTAGRSGKATASMIVGIVAVIAALIPILGIVLGVIAVSLGGTSKAEIRRTGQSNRWAALTGLTLGTIAIVLAVVIWVANIAMMS